MTSSEAPAAAVAEVNPSHTFEWHGVSARLTVNGGVASGIGTTPWQALDAAVDEWRALVDRLARSLTATEPETFTRFGKEHAARLAAP